MKSVNLFFIIGIISQILHAQTINIPEKKPDGKWVKQLDNKKNKNYWVYSIPMGSSKNKLIEPSVRLFIREEANIKEPYLEFYTIETNEIGIIDTEKNKILIKTKLFDYNLKNYIILYQKVFLVTRYLPADHPLRKEYVEFVIDGYTQQGAMIFENIKGGDLNLSPNVGDACFYIKSLNKYYAADGSDYTEKALAIIENKNKKNNDMAEKSKNDIAERKQNPKFLVNSPLTGKVLVKPDKDSKWTYSYKDNLITYQKDDETVLYRSDLEYASLKNFYTGGFDFMDYMLVKKSSKANLPESGLKPGQYAILNKKTCKITTVFTTEFIDNIFVMWTDGDKKFSYLKVQYGNGYINESKEYFNKFYAVFSIEEAKCITPLCREVSSFNNKMILESDFVCICKDFEGNERYFDKNGKDVREESIKLIEQRQKDEIAKKESLLKNQKYAQGEASKSFMPAVHPNGRWTINKYGTLSYVIQNKDFQTEKEFVTGFIEEQYHDDYVEITVANKSGIINSRKNIIVVNPMDGYTRTQAFFDPYQQENALVFHSIFAAYYEKENEKMARIFNDDGKLLLETKEENLLSVHYFLYVKEKTKVESGRQYYKFTPVLKNGLLPKADGSFSKVTVKQNTVYYENAVLQGFENIIDYWYDEEFRTLNCIPYSDSIRKSLKYDIYPSYKIHVNSGKVWVANPLSAYKNAVLDLNKREDFSTIVRGFGGNQKLLVNNASFSLYKDGRPVIAFYDDKSQEVKIRTYSDIDKGSFSETKFQLTESVPHKVLCLPNGDILVAGREFLKVYAENNPNPVFTLPEDQLVFARQNASGVSGWKISYISEQANLSSFDVIRATLSPDGKHVICLFANHRKEASALYAYIYDVDKRKMKHDCPGTFFLEDSNQFNQLIDKCDAIFLDNSTFILYTKYSNGEYLPGSRFNVYDVLKQRGNYGGAKGCLKSSIKTENYMQKVNAMLADSYQPNVFYYVVDYVDGTNTKTNIYKAIWDGGNIYTTQSATLNLKNVHFLTEYDKNTLITNDRDGNIYLINKDSFATKKIGRLDMFSNKSRLIGMAPADASRKIWYAFVDNYYYENTPRSSSFYLIRCNFREAYLK